MPEPTKQWYSNKELFEKIQNLNQKLSQTIRIIDKYNGLRENQGEMMEKIEKLVLWKKELEGSQKGFKDASYWLKWGVIVMLSIANLLSLTGVM